MTNASHPRPSALCQSCAFAGSVTRPLFTYRVHTSPSADYPVGATLLMHEDCAAVGAKFVTEVHACPEHSVVHLAGPCNTNQEV